MTEEQDKEWNRIAKAAKMSRLQLEMFINDSLCCNNCTIIKDLEERAVASEQRFKQAAERIREIID